MSALEEIADLVDTMRARKGESVAFEGLLTEISTTLADILAQMEKPHQDIGMALAELVELMDRSAAEQRTVSKAIIDGLKVLSIKPPEVEVQAPPSVAFKGYTLTVVDRGPDNSIRRVKFVPDD